MGPRTELPTIKALEDIGYGNGTFVPATALMPLPWAGNGKHKVAQVFCEAFWPDGSLMSVCPRTVARKQFERLEQRGYQLYSGFEAEFMVVDAKTKQPLFDGVDFGVDQILAENSEWMFDAEKQLASVGVDICAIHPEYSPGQFECALAPQYGMKTPDNMMIFKQAFREILLKYNLQPTFMTRPFANDGGCSGFHLNHSLWSNDGKCLFYDVSKPDNMSDVMRYWLGGIMKHLTVLNALCSPTPNCYRRLHQPWAPHKHDWGIDNRGVSVRVKSHAERTCLVENRLPSSASNAYLTVAGTIAAGLDGIDKKIEPPPKGIHDASPLLPGFEDCLKALEESDVMRQSLGEDFIQWFLLAKRQNELSKFSDLTLTGPIPEEEIRKEREEYFKLI